MNEYGIDWSMRNGISVYSPVGKESRHYDTLDDFARDINEPSRFFIESTFGSFDKKRRASFIDACISDGHELLVTPTRLTARFRKANGIHKTDDADARVIFEIGHTSAARKYKKPDVIMSRKREAANMALMDMRRTMVTPSQKALFAGGRQKLESKKDLFAKEIKKRIVRWNRVDFGINRKAFTDSNKDTYHLTTLSAIGAAALQASSVREFESIAGLSANGYPCQIRADLHHWNWSGGNQRGKLKKVREFKESDGTVRPVYSGRKDGMTLTEWRRAMRWLYRQIKPVVRDAMEATERISNV